MEERREIRSRPHLARVRRERDSIDVVTDDAYSKPLTDLCYNTSISTIISTLSAQLIGPHPEMALSVVFGTHNNESVEKVIDELKRHNLAIDLQGSDPTVPGKLRMRDDVKGKVFIAQLYGES